MTTPILILILAAVLLFAFALRFVWDSSPPEDESKYVRTSPPDVNISDSFSPRDSAADRGDTPDSGSAARDIERPDLFSMPEGGQSYKVTPSEDRDNSFIVAAARQPDSPSPRDDHPSYKVIPLEENGNTFAVTAPPILK